MLNVALNMSTYPGSILGSLRPTLIMTQASQDMAVRANDRL